MNLTKHVQDLRADNEKTLTKGLEGDLINGAAGAWDGGVVH